MFYWMMKIIFWPLIQIVFCFPCIHGKDNLPKKGGAIVVSNHVSNGDPVLLIFLLVRAVHFLAKKQLFSSPIKKWFFTGMKAIPVGRDGNDVTAVRASLSTVGQGKLLGVFPEGKRNKGDGMLPFEKGVAFIALRSKVPVVPVAFRKRYGLFRRPEIVMGQPISFPQYYDQRISQEVVTDVNQMIQLAVSDLREGVIT
ncbi:MAG: lysophospholipid acyltransferase family protein [Christensenellales bacterium]|jgi:1-acyl-sn-glycerol-3-phosphate acyltransferase